MNDIAGVDRILWNRKILRFQRAANLLDAAPIKTESNAPSGLIVPSEYARRVCGFAFPIARFGLWDSGLFLRLGI